MKKLLLFLFIIAACTAPAAQDVSFTTIDQGSSSGVLDAKKLVIVSQQEWEALWREAKQPYDPAPELPEVDFTTENVIAVFMGSHNTGGYSIEIVNIIDTGDQLEVQIKETRPGLADIVTQAFTQPYHLVKVNAKKPVTFVTVDE